MQIPLFSRWVVVLVGMALLVLFWWRAGSMHTLMERLWFLLAGKTDVHDPVLQRLFQQNRDLEKFRFCFHLNADRLEDIHRLSAWMSAHGEGLSKLQKMRRWVDLKSPELVQKPAMRHVVRPLGVALAAVLLMGALTPLASSPWAYLQMRESRVWFKADASSAHGLWGSWAVNGQTCTSDLALVMQQTGFLDNEARSLCQSLRNGELKSLVKETRAFQGWAGITATLLLMGMAWLCVLAASQATEARALRKRLDTAAS